MDKPALADFTMQDREAVCGVCGDPFTQHVLESRVRNSGWPAAMCPKCVENAAFDEREEERRKHAAATLDELLVPPLYAGATMEKFELWGAKDDREKQEAVRSMAMNYVTIWPRVPSVTVFQGGSGTGKGHVAWAIVKWLVYHNQVAARFAGLPEIIRDIREAWTGVSGETEYQKLARYRDPDLLVIDEVSSHAFYGEPTRHLYDLINYRIEWMCPTIVTTNESADGLEKLLGPALTSRMAGNVWDFGQADYRTKDLF